MLQGPNYVSNCGIHYISISRTSKHATNSHNNFKTQIVIARQIQQADMDLIRYKNPCNMAVMLLGAQSLPLMDHTRLSKVES